MQTSVLLSIKPQFVEKIFQGVKKYEFRKALFKNRNVKKIVIYASAPISKVVGEFEIDRILELQPALLWKQTKKHSGIPKDYFDEYFNGREFGYAIKIRGLKLYSTPLDLYRHFNVKYPPQSFMYLGYKTA